MPDAPGTHEGDEMTEGERNEFERRADEYLRREEEERDAERWQYEALHDPTSDAYYSDGAREARIDGGFGEKP